MALIMGKSPIVITAGIRPIRNQKIKKMASFSFLKNLKIKIIKPM